MSRSWQDDLATAARAALPAAAWEYVRTGAREEVTASEASRAWAAYRLWPRVLRDVTAPDPAVRLLGTSYALPVGVAPTSLQRCAHPEGELAMARAAAAVGVPLVVSSNAGFPFARIGAEVGDAAGSWWLQAYLTQERDLCLPVLEAALAAGASAVVLTLDTPFPGTKYGVNDDDWPGVDLSWHRCNYPPGVSRGQRGRWARDVAAADIAWLAARTGVPVVVKGVLRPDDARRCVAAGAAAVWVSNHGGRQLDRSVTTAEALPPVVAALGECIPVYVDGGIRSGLDVVTALALGAEAVFLGRLPYLALAAGGPDGVEASLRRLGVEIREAMALAGCPTTAACRGIAGLPEGGRQALPPADLRESGV
ncbi:MAG: alpha-hydroxy acid oxidase [Marmoricola sp.]